MRFKQLMQVAVVACSLLALGACSTGKRNNGTLAAGSGDANSTEVNGLGENENFGDSTNGRNQHAANKNTYYFDFDKSDIRSDDKPHILSKADQLATQPHKKIILEGHTDPRGSREYNVALGERRANSVADLMKSKGVASNQVRVVSYGAERLAAEGRNEQAYQLDRRAVIDN